MRSTFAAAALVGLAAANPLPAGGAPSAPAPAGCSPNYNGQFEIEVVNVTSSSKKRDTVLTLTLKDGVLTDEDGRQGYIASNYQFQFNTPIQVNAQYTSGFSACSNGSLALGGSAVFYQCLSGTFYNLYDESTGAQCSPVTIDIINGASASGSGSTTVVSQQSDGQPTETPVSSPVCEYTDGQPQETACPVTQISDGQIQATTGVPVTQISDGQIQATTAATPVTQISDGQIQATTAAPVSQISDGQVQATTGTPVTQISDGQVQATTGTPVTQISDGQIQATTGTPVTQISDGQIQATTGTPVTQISDGQIQATTAATSAPYVAGAGKVEGGLFGLAAALLAAVAL